MPQFPSAVGKYFDYNGSTPLHPRIQALCLDLQQEYWGNSAAGHPAGRAASKIVEASRAKLARALGASPSEIDFTSGGTESTNWVLFGAARGRTSGHIVTSAIEHKSVLASARELESRGIQVTYVAPRSDGAVHLRDLEAELREDTFLVSVMWANNETGVCQPVRDIATLCKKRNLLFHSDAVAAMGKLPIDLSDVACDFLSLSAHKFHAPKGVGALFIREGAQLAPLLFGCGHQNGLRSGTENTVGIAGMAEAAALASAGEFGMQSALEARRNQLFNGLRERFPDCQRNGAGGMLPNTINVYFPGLPSAKFQRSLAEMGFSVAAGASASNGTPSHVLLAMGLSPERASQSLRFSLGHPTTAAHVDDLLEHIPMAAEAVRSGTSIDLSEAR